MRPRIRTNTLTGYAELARSQGLDPAALMAAVGLDIADLEVPERWIPAAPVARLLELSAQQSDCPDFGLRLASLPPARDPGPPQRRAAGGAGPAQRTGPPDPLRARVQRAPPPAAEGGRRPGDARDVAGVRRARPARPGPRPRHGGAGGDRPDARAERLGTASASFSRPPPPDPDPWRRVFGPGVLFDRDFTGVVFREQDLRGGDRGVGLLPPAVHPAVPPHGRRPGRAPDGRHGGGRRRGDGGTPAAPRPPRDRAGEPVPGPPPRTAPAESRRPRGDVLLRRERHAGTPGGALSPERAATR